MREFETFFRANEARVHCQMARLNIAGDWYSEFYAEGLVALWQAYQTYDKERGTIGMYLNYRIRYRLIDLLRKKKREARNKRLEVQDMLGRIDHGNRACRTGLPVVDQQGIILGLEAESFWQEVRSRLSERQWKWVEYIIIAELTVQEVMELEGVSADAVKSWGREVRRKLRHDDVKRVLEEVM